MKKILDDALLNSVSTLSDVPDTSAGLIDNIYDNTLILRGIEAGPGIFINVVDADNTTFSTTQKKIIISSIGSQPNGEANIGQNIGTGEGIYATKNGVALLFKSFVAGDGIIIQSSSTEIGISSTAVSSGSNIGSGYGIFAGINGTQIQFKSITAGNNIQIIPTASGLNISSTGESNDGQNLGTGGPGTADIYSQKLGTSLLFRRLRAGNNILLTQTNNEISIDAASLGEANTGNNIGSGSGIYASKSGTTLNFRSIVAASSNIIVQQNLNNISLDVVGDINDGQNLGTSDASKVNIFAGKTGNSLTFKKLSSGSHISFNDSSDTIVISATDVGEINTGNNLGIDSDGSRIFSDKNGTTLNFRRIKAGQNITVTEYNNYIELNSIDTVGMTHVSDDHSPTLGGNLDIGTFNIVSSSNRDIVLTPNGIGQIVLDGTRWPVSTGTLGQYLSSDGNGSLVWLDPTSGEINSGTNIGTNGTNVYASKIGTVLQFKKLYNTDGKISITDSQNTDQVIFSIVESNLTLDNLGGALSLTKGGTGATTALSARNNLGLKSMSVQDSTAISITGGSIDGVTIGGSNPAPISVTNLTANGSIILNGLTFPSHDGSVNQVLTTNGSGSLSWSTPSGGGSGGGTSDGSNLGSGSGIYSGISGITLNFKSLTSGNHITLTPTSTEINISSDGEPNDASNRGSEDSITKGFYLGKNSAPGSYDLQFKRLRAGTGLSFTSVTQDYIELSYSGSTGLSTGKNLGGSANVYSGISGTEIQFRGLTAGSAISLTQNTNDITIGMDINGLVDNLTDIQNNDYFIIYDNSINGLRKISFSSMKDNIESGYINSVQSLGGTASVYANVATSTLNLRGITTLNPLTITQNTNDISIGLNIDGQPLDTPISSDEILFWNSVNGFRKSTISSLPGVETSRNIVTNGGLQGGGNLSSDRTISIAATGVNSGITGSNNVIPVITVNAQGQLTNVSTATVTPSSIGAAPLSHTQTWSTITSTPTTVAGYGITDAFSATRNIATGSGLTGGGDLSADRTISINNSITAGNNIGSSSVVPVISYNTEGLLTTVNTATITPVTIGASPLSHTHPWSTITSTPTTVAGYGITDALSATRNIVAGVGLMGGGDLSADRTISINNSITAGSNIGSSSVVPVISYNAEGLLTTVSTATITPTTIGAAASSHTQAWSTITLTPTTVAGYGITDALSSTRNIATGTGLTGGGNLSADRTISINNTITSGNNIGSSSVVPVITYNTSGLLTAVSTATITPATIGAAPTSHTQAWSTITSTPTTIAGYGITDSLSTVRNIATGAGLTGGGDLSADRTISINNSITAGSNIGSSSVVPVISYNAEGLLTTVSTATITPVTIGAAPYSHTQAWSTITATPTTLVGYGITDSLSTTRNIVAGSGLTGGGDLSADRTISINNSIAAGNNIGSSSVVPVISYNAEGLLTTVSTATITPVTIGAAPTSHTQAWSTITSTPTTVAGYGITDALSSTRNIATGTGLTGGGNLSADRTISINNTITAGNNIGSSSVVPVITYNTSGLLTAVNTATITPITIGAAASSHTQAWSTITSTPTTVAGYGITDAAISSRIITTDSTLSGGGDLTADRTLSVVASAIGINSLNTSTPLAVGGGGIGRATLTSNALLIGNGTGAVALGPTPGVGNDQQYLQWNNTTNQYQFATPSGMSQPFTSPYVISVPFGSTGTPTFASAVWPTGLSDNGSTGTTLKVSHTLGKEPKLIMYCGSRSGARRYKVMQASGSHYLELPISHFTDQFNIYSFSTTNLDTDNSTTAYIYVYFS